MKKIVYIVLFLFLTCIYHVPPAVADPIITIEPGITGISVGKTFSVKVVIVNEDIIDMSAWNGTLSFNPALLTLKNTFSSSFACQDSNFYSNEPTVGKLIMVYYTYPTCSLSGQGTIAGVEFEASGAGEAVITPADFVFSDPNANGIPVTITNEVIKFVITACKADLDFDGDVDGYDLAKFVIEEPEISIEEIAAEFGRTDCLE